MRLPPVQRPGSMSRDLCIMACTFARDAQFHAWMQHLYQQECPDGSEFPCTESSAKAFILAACGVTSRRELDTVPAAAHQFHTVVRVPYLAWKREASGAHRV